MTQIGYGAPDFPAKVREALDAAFPADHVPTLTELAGLDHFHTRGIAATAELADLSAVTRESRVLDVGSESADPPDTWQQHMVVRSPVSI